MYNKKLLSLVLCLIACVLPVSAGEVKDTLYSDARDKICLTYDVDYQGDDVTITFKAIKKYLSDYWNGRYELSKVKVLFFERDGGFSNEHFKGDVTPVSMWVPANDIVYDYSNEGYVWIESDARLKLRLLADEALLSLPVYLANYEKKYTYKLIADCGELNIHLRKGVLGRSSGGTIVSGQEIVLPAEEVLVEGTSDDEIVEFLLARMEDALLREMTPDELSDLKEDYAELRRLEPTIANNRLKDRIGTMLQRVRDREKEMEMAGSRAEEELQMRQQLKDARNNMDYLNERLDNIDDLSEGDLAELKTLANDLRRKSKDVKGMGGSEAEQLSDKMVTTADRCDKALKAKEDARKRRSLWMIIGGIVLVLLMFVGNQVFQHLRNVRNQKSIKDMQDKMTKQAKDETRRRMRNAVRSKVNQAESTVRQTSRNAVRNGVNNGVNSVIKKKGNKGFTV